MMKKLTALLMAVVMMMALATSASATETPLTTTGTVTFTNAASGVTYKFYRLFDIAETDGSLHLYITNNKWSNVTFKNSVSSYVTADDGEGNIVSKTSSFADAAFLAAVDVSGLTADKEITPANTGSISIDDLRYGYYVMTSSRGGGKISAFTVSSKAVEITEKNTNLPNIAKTVNDLDEDTVSKNDTLTYKIVVEAAAGTDAYTITDTIPTGVTVNDTTISVTCDNSSVTGLTATHTGNKITVEIAKDSVARKALRDNDKITITYNASLNSDAPMGEAIKNEVVLNYAGGEDETADAVVYTYQLTVNKVDENGNSLTGAGFKLQMKNASDEWEDVETITSTTEIPLSTFVFKGLDNGSYKVVETTIPTGYIKADDVEKTITDNNVTVNIKNIPGQELPETGGMGTTALYAVGAVLMLGAVAVLAGKKKVFEK